MYNNDRQPANLGDFQSQATSFAASTVAKYSASYLAAAIGFGSMAGPIGTIVGAIVSIFMSIFGGGGVVKKPIYSLGLVLPSYELPTIGNLILASRHFIAVSGNVPGTKDWTQDGAIAIAEGGLSTTHTTVASAIPQIVQKQVELVRQFQEVFASIPASHQATLWTLPLPISKEPLGKWKEADLLMTEKAYYWTGSLPPGFIAYVITSGESLGTVVDKGYRAIVQELGAALEEYASELALQVNPAQEAAVQVASNNGVTPNVSAMPATDTLPATVGSTSSMRPLALLLAVAAVVVSTKRKG
jgi:hypothetical protein